MGGISHFAVARLCFCMGSLCGAPVSFAWAGAPTFSGLWSVALGAGKVKPSGGGRKRKTLLYLPVVLSTVPRR